MVRTDVEALVVRRVNSRVSGTFPEAKRGADMACCGTRSRVDGPEACTVCLEPLPLPGPGGDCVLVLHACGHAFHRDCAQDFLLDALRRRRTPRCPNCRATLHTAPFGKLLGQRKLPRSRRMKNMRQLITVSEVRRFFYPLFPTTALCAFFRHGPRTRRARRPSRLRADDTVPPPLLTTGIHEAQELEGAEA